MRMGWDVRGAGGGVECRREGVIGEIGGCGRL